MPRKPVVFTGSRIVEGKVEDFHALLDPQNWQRTVPLIWKKSHLLSGLPADRNVNPPARTVEGSWCGQQFFEVVSLPFVSRHRNILVTSLTLGRSKAEEPTEDDEVFPTQTVFEYSQYECLTSTFLGVKSRGGIDIDNGYARCEQVDDTHVKITIAKRVRFTQPHRLLPLVDVFSKVAVKLLLEMLLVGLDLDAFGGNTNG